MMSIDINNINTLVAILSGLLSILGLLAHTITKKLEDSSDLDGIINKTIFNKEKELIDNYFKNLTYEELLSLKENPSKIDNRTHNILANISKNAPVSIAAEKVLNEITRKDRYRLSIFILSKIDNSSSRGRTFSLLLTLISNYLFYLSKFLLYLFIYGFIAFLFSLPIYYIIIMFILFYNNLNITLFYIFCSLLVLLLFIFGQKD